MLFYAARKIRNVLDLVKKLAERSVLALREAAGEVSRQLGDRGKTGTMEEVFNECKEGGVELGRLVGVA